MKQKIPRTVLSAPEFQETRERFAKTAAPPVVAAKARVGPFCVELVSNSEHLMTFWRHNWPAADHDGADATISAFLTSEAQDPFAAGCPSLCAGLIVNTEHYNQVKSLALGLLSHLAEQEQHQYLFIPGSLLDSRGKGIVFIGPSKTGKTTLTFRLLQNRSNGMKYLANGPFYVDRHGIGYPTETGMFTRTTIVASMPEFEAPIKRSYLQNADPDNLAEAPKSRCLVDPAELIGAENIAERTRVATVFLLDRDFENQATMTALTQEDAFRRIRAGHSIKYDSLQYVAGRTPKVRRTKSQPYFDVSLFDPNSAALERLYRNFLDKTSVFLVNTTTSPERTLQEIETIIA